MHLSDSQLYRLRYQHHTMGELVNGLSEAQLRTPVNPGKWSVHENIAHLVAYQPTFIVRLRRIINEHEPAFDRYVADNDPAFTEAVNKPTDVLLAQANEDRTIILKELLSLGEQALIHAAVHPRYGKLNIIQWTEFFLLHEAHHLFTTFMLTAGLRKTQP